MYDWISDGKRIEGWIAHKESEIPRLLAANIRPLYTAPQPAQRQSRSDVKPLTDEQIYDLYNEPRSDAEMVAFARAIEAAHGIKA